MILKKILSQVPFLNWTFYGITLGSWLAFVVISVLVFLGLRWIQRLLVRWLGRLVSHTATRFDDFIVKLIRETSRVFLALVALYAGSSALTLRPRTTVVIESIVLVAFLVQVGLWGSQIIGYAIQKLSRRPDTEDGGLATAMGALTFITRIAWWSILGLLILSTLGINITALVAGLGVGGVAIALAVQSILGDLFASLSILLDKPFAVGHFIVIDDLAGTVEHVGIKSTRVRSLSGEEIVLSNGDLLKSRIHNYKHLYERRVLFGFGVTYDTKYEKLVAIPSMVREIIEQIPKTRFDRTHFKAYGDSSLNFEVVYYVLSPDYNLYMDIQQNINLGIYQRFEEQRIEFAFPTRTLYVYQSTPSAPSGDSQTGPERDLSQGSGD